VKKRKTPTDEKKTTKAMMGLNASSVDHGQTLSALAVQIAA
jgi:hypothetical protein